MYYALYHIVKSTYVKVCALTWNMCQKFILKSVQIVGKKSREGMQVSEHSGQD